MCSPQPCRIVAAVEDPRAKERFAASMKVSLLKVNLGRWTWKPDQPRPPWDCLKEAPVWKAAAHAPIRAALAKPPALPTIVLTADEAHLRSVEFHKVGPGPGPRAEEEAEEDEPPERESEEETQPATHTIRTYLYRASEEVPEIASKCHVGLVLIHAPPRAAVRLPSQVAASLEDAPCAVYGSPANVSSVVESVRRLVGERVRVDVDVWVKPIKPVHAPGAAYAAKLIKRSLTLIAKPNEIFRSRVCFRLRALPCCP